MPPSATPRPFDRHFLPSLDPGQMALLRAWAAGLSWFAITRTYCPEREPSAVMAEVEALLAELAAFARQAGRPELAAALTGGPRADPGWERAAQHAFATIPRLTLPDAQPDDPIDRWFPARIAAPLRRKGLVTLADLAGFAAVAGWWRQVPRLSGPALRELRAFFQAQPRLPPLQEAEWLPAPVEPRPPTTEVAPLDLFLPPPHLEGGEVRRPGDPPDTPSRTGYPTDRAAIGAWLRGFIPGSATFRAYRRDAERFWLWLVLVKGKTLATVVIADLEDYRAFLAAPEPAARWCGPRQHRDSPAWRPFDGPLSRDAIRYAEGVLRRLFGWLVEARYLMANPYAAVRPLRPTPRGEVAAKALTQEEWQAVLDLCRAGSQGDGPEAARYRHALFALRLAYATGLRIGNLAAATLGDIRPVPARGGEPGLRWWLHCRVKGGHDHKVPLAAVLTELQDYLRFRGYTAPLDALGPGIPLIGKGLRRRGEDGPRDEPYSARGLHDLFAWVFTRAAAAHPDAAAVTVDRLRRARAHTLRHTHATHALDKGMPVKVVQRNLHHSSLSTTTLYASDDEEVRYRESGKLG